MVAMINPHSIYLPLASMLAVRPRVKTNAMLFIKQYFSTLAKMYVDECWDQNLLTEPNSGRNDRCKKLASA